MKFLNSLIFLCVSAPVFAGANAYFETTFPTSKLPTSMTSDEAAVALSKESYKNLTDGQAWFLGRTDVSDISAIAATRGEEGQQRCGRLYLPAITPDAEGARLIWDARSMHRNLRDSYRVIYAVGDSDEWNVLEEVTEESYFWKTHIVDLPQLGGEKLRLAFETVTEPDKGFMLAVDNIFIGVPEQAKVIYEPSVTHFVGDGELASIGGKLSITAEDAAQNCRIAVVNKEGNELCSSDFADEIELTFPISLGERVAYDVVAIFDDGRRDVLYSDEVICSWFARRLLLDRFSGTWCNNCPPMEITISDYERRYGDELIAAEVHVNDLLQEPTYWSDYGRDFVYDVPSLALNHNPETYKDNDRNGAFADELDRETIAKVSAKATRVKNRYVKFDSEVTFAQTLDNSADRYRIGYLLLADVHNPAEQAYTQANSSPSIQSGQYYYMPDRISPAMMFFDNLVVEGSTAAKGVVGSLPKMIQAFEPQNVSYTLSIPEKWADLDFRAVAIILDTETGLVLNCDSAPAPISSGIVDSCVEATDDGAVYDLAGRRVDGANLAPGLYISGGCKIIVR